MQDDSVRLAVLEKIQEQSEKEMRSLRDTVSEIGKLNTKVSELLAVHEVKFEQQKLKEQELYKRVETGISKLTKIMDDDREKINKKMDQLTEKMESDKNEIYDKMDGNKDTVLQTFDNLKKDFDNIKSKIFIGIGIAVALQAMITVIAPWALTKLEVGLTKPPTSARVQGN